MEACPRKSLINSIGAPFSDKCVAIEWRKICKFTRRVKRDFERIRTMPNHFENKY